MTNIFIESLPNLIPTIGTFFIGVLIGFTKFYPQDMLPMVYNLIYCGLYPIILLDTNAWIGITITEWKLIGIWVVHSIISLLSYWLFPKRVLGPVLLADSNSIFVATTNQFHYISRLGAFLLLPVYYFICFLENRPIKLQSNVTSTDTDIEIKQTDIVESQIKDESKIKQILVIVFQPLFVMTVLTMLLSLIPGIRPAFPYAIQASFNLLKELPEPLGYVCAGVAAFFGFKDLTKQKLKVQFISWAKILLLLLFKQFLLPYIYGLIASNFNIQPVEIQQFRRTLSIGPGTLIFLFDYSLDAVFALTIGQFIAYFSWIIW